MKALRLLALALFVTTAACGDDGTPADPDANTPDADIDAPATATFTSYVLDLIQNQTASNTDSKPFSEVEALPDPDRDNENAYEALFP